MGQTCSDSQSVTTRYVIDDHAHTDYAYPEPKANWSGPNRVFESDNVAVKSEPEEKNKNSEVLYTSTNKPDHITSITFQKPNNSIVEERLPPGPILPSLPPGPILPILEPIKNSPSMPKPPNPTLKRTISFSSINYATQSSQQPMADHARNQDAVYDRPEMMMPTNRYASEKQDDRRYDNMSVSPSIASRQTIKTRRVTNMPTSDGLYTGPYSDSVGKHGDGKLIMNDGSTYEGSFMNDKFNGKATITQTDRGFVKGTWLIGLKDGDFEELWNDGKEYFKGTYQNNMRNGFGILKLADGKVYEGGFENGLFHGTGKAIMPAEQMRYEGEFRDGKMSGRGVMIWMDEGGAAYDGELIDGIRSGFGVYTDHAKNKYIGYWKNDKREGNGILMTEQGAKYNMTFNMDREIKKELEIDDL